MTISFNSYNFVYIELKVDFKVLLCVNLPLVSGIINHKVDALFLQSQNNLLNFVSCHSNLCMCLNEKCIKVFASLGLDYQLQLCTYIKTLFHFLKNLPVK